MDSEAQKAEKEIVVANAPIDTFDGTDEKIASRQVDAALQWRRGRSDLLNTREEAGWSGGAI
jgi:hypothetical protein